MKTSYALAKWHFINTGIFFLIKCGEILIYVFKKIFIFCQQKNCIYTVNIKCQPNLINSNF